MVSFVDPFAASLIAGNWSDLGAHLHENWKLKQSLASGISNPRIQEAYEAGLAAGAWGGKLLGAGGGGFMLFLAPPSAHAALDAAMNDCRPFPFQLDTEGSKVIFNG